MTSAATTATAQRARRATPKVVRLSDTFATCLGEKSLGTEQKREDEQSEHDRRRHLGPDVEVGQGFHQAEPDTDEQGSGDPPESRDHHDDEGLEDVVEA